VTECENARDEAASKYVLDMTGAYGPLAMKFDYKKGWDGAREWFKQRMHWQSKTIHKQTEAIARLRTAIANVLCNPEGKACFEGSDADRAEIDNAMAEVKEMLK